MDQMTAKIGAIATLQTVLEQVEALSDLSRRERREMTSSIYSFAAKLNRQPRDIPARLDVVERLGGEMNAVGLGISAGRLRNIKSLVRKALAATDHNAAPARLNFPLRHPWSGLVDLFPDRRSRIALARLFRIFQVLGIAPAEVSVAAFDRVLEYLRAAHTPRPEANYRELVLAWNRLSILLRPYRT
jgi:hypothetical protein